MSIFPVKSDREVEQHVEVVGLEEEGGDELLDALSSQTARRILITINEEPMPPNEIAEAIDSSLQNTNYHLQKMKSAGIIRPIDTEYSKKGREMTVYAPSSQPLIIVSGTETESIRSAVRTLLGALAGLTLASLIAQLLLPDVPTQQEIMNQGGGPVAMPVPQGLVFFIGGAFILVILFVFWYVNQA